MSKLIVANWKMNPEKKSRAIALARSISHGVRNIKKTEVVICPPSVFLESISKVLTPNSYILKPILGVQDCAWKNSGPHTGSISPSMLYNMGARYVILGHSERRRDYGETDVMVGQKVLAAVGAGLIPIICIGEWNRKGKSMSQTRSIIRSQLAAVFRGLGKSSRNRKMVIAYEPVWSISTVGGGEETPKDASEVIRYIKKLSSFLFPLSSPRIIYGGSVNKKNARLFLQYPDIEGALVGGASLKAKDFVRIIHDAENMRPRAL